MHRRLHPRLQVLVVLVVLVGTVDEEGRPSLLPGDAHAASAATARLTDRALDAAKSVKQIGDSAVAPARRFVLDRPVRAKLGRWGVAYLPRGLWLTETGDYDLVVHFHGGSQVVEPLFQDSGLNAVLVTVNLGVGSRAYRNWADDPQAFARALEAIDEVVKRHSPAPRAQLRRLALSSWSAGYGAVVRILSRPEHRQRIDAVLLADGIHAPLADPQSRHIAERGMEPFVRFAEAAQAGDKLMLLTHSQILTGPYASTTETAEYLVTELELPPSPTAAAPEGMQPTSRHSQGGLHVTAYAGDDAPAHCQHLRHIDETMLAPLRARWTA